MIRQLLCSIFLLLSLLSVAGGQDFRLQDVTEKSGLSFQHFSGLSGKNYIVETITCGIATFDFDGDGLIDIYLPSGNTLQGKPIDPQQKNRLFRNLGNMRFVDVTDQSGAGDLSFAMGVAAGDMDHDGDVDLWVANFGDILLLENCGDATFHRRVIDQSSGEVPRIGAGISLLDFDSDGWLDVFVSRYVKFDYSKDVSRLIYGIPGAPGPTDYPPDSDALYRNNGDGSFVDVSKASGIANQSGPGMGVVSFDYDDDGDSDIFVCNDSAANFLYENQGDGTFEEVALLMGLAYDVTGAKQASMGVDVGDVDRDGFLDLITTNFLGEIPPLYQNSGAGFFDDIGASAGLGRADTNVSWGVGLVDLDNDRWQDCFIVAGHLIEGVADITDADKFEAAHVVLRNHEGQFVPAEVEGDALNNIKVSRGAAFDDLDNDGWLDAVILNLNSSAQLIHNETSAEDRHFLQLRLVGTRSNRSAAGAKIRVRAGGQELVSEHILGRGYQSHFGDRIHFGLGSSAIVESIEITWPSGSVQKISNVEADQELLVVEEGAES